MKNEVIILFNDEYKLENNQFKKKFEKLYEDPFQKQKCIRIVASINDKIIGFQSYFYWPYKYDGNTYNSFQSGNSIVSKNHRGKGIFGLMLEKIDEIVIEKKIDFLIGFPVAESIGSFKRKKWLNKFNLSWYIKPISYNPFIFLKKTNSNLKKEKLHFDLKMKNYLVLENTSSFNQYRSKFSGEKLYFQYKKNDTIIELCYKISIRKKIIKELTIGNVEFNHFNEDIINDAFSFFIKSIKKNKIANFISFAISDNANIFNKILLNQGFKSINKKIFFIHKCNKKIDLNNILLFRSDIDTW